MAFEQGIMTEGMNQIYSDNKRSVTLYRATKTTSNISGSEELSYGDAETVELIFFKTTSEYDFGPEGLLEKGDCVIFDKPNNVGLAKNDKIEVDGETFIIKNRPIAWKSRGQHIYDAAVGYLQ